MGNFFDICTALLFSFFRKEILDMNFSYIPIFLMMQYIVSRYLALNMNSVTLKSFKTNSYEKNRKLKMKNKSYEK